MGQPKLAITLSRHLRVTAITTPLSISSLHPPALTHTHTRTHTHVHVHIADRSRLKLSVHFIEFHVPLETNNGRE